MNKKRNLRGKKLILSFIFKKEYWPLFTLCLIVLISHFLYVYITRQYPQEDEHSYLAIAIGFFDLFRSPKITIMQDMYALINYRQPLFSFILSIVFLFTGLTQAYKIALFTNGIFYCITIIGVYLLAKEYFSKTVSFLAALLFAFYGFPLFYLHFLYSETATTAFIVIALLFLKKSNFFQDRRNTILFSIFFTCSVLTRWAAIVFLSGPFFTVLCIYLFKVFLLKQKNIKANNLLWFIFFGIVPALVLYYVPKANSFFEYVKGGTENATRWVSILPHLSPSLADRFSVHSMMFYFNILSQQTILLFGLFLISILVATYHYRRYYFLLSAIVFPYIFFTFGSVLKLDRYIVPLYPIMALLTVVVVNHFKSMVVKNLIIMVIILISFLNFLGSSWGLGPMGKEGLKSIVLPEFIRHPRRIYLTPIVWPPTKEYSNAEKFVQTILHDAKKNKLNKKVKVLVTFSNYPWENAVTSISSYERREEIDILFIRNIEKNDFRELFRRVRDADYIVTKNKNIIDDYRYSGDNEVYMFELFEKVLLPSKGELPKPFLLVYEIPIPIDQSVAKIYSLSEYQKEEEIQTLKHMIKDTEYTEKL